MRRNDVLTAADLPRSELLTTTLGCISDVHSIGPTQGPSCPMSSLRTCCGRTSGAADPPVASLRQAVDVINASS
jgi:hypothetical protein